MGDKIDSRASADAVTAKPAKHRPHGQTLAEALPWILERVRSGIPINHACGAAGFSKQALYTHCQRHPEDREALDQAKDEGEQWLVMGLYDAARDDPKFGLLLLERRRPEEWGKADRVELSGPGGGAIKSEVTVQPTRAEALAELRSMAASDPEVARALLEAVGGDDRESE